MISFNATTVGSIALVCFTIIFLFCAATFLYYKAVTFDKEYSKKRFNTKVESLVKMHEERFEAILKSREEEFKNLEESWEYTHRQLSADNVKLQEEINKIHAYEEDDIIEPIES